MIHNGKFLRDQARLGLRVVKIAAACALAAMSLLSAKPARAGQLGADIIALFPKEVGEFAYADLKKARTMKWFPQLQEQMLPERFRLLPTICRPSADFRGKRPQLRDWLGLPLPGLGFGLPNLGLSANGRSPAGFAA